MPVRSNPPLVRALRLLLVAAMLAATGGCVGPAWKRALEDDTPAAYYRFMRDHPESRYAEDAQERLDFHKLRRSPSLGGFEAFRERYPGSELIDRLRPALEEPAYEVARARGTAEAYRAFVDAFADGLHAARARGNAIYIEQEGFGGDPEALAVFARAHPESDFAAEARRTAEAVRARAAGSIDRVGLVLDVASTTPEAGRIRQAFVDRIEDLARAVGVEVVELPELIEPGEADAYPAARIEVRHTEREVETSIQGGDLARPARVGETEVVLRDAPEGEAIFHRQFTLRVEAKAHVPGTSVLFSAVAPRYWDELFIPVARWRNDRAVRPPIALDSTVVDVDGVGDRVVVLYEDGDFDVLGLADPTRPVTLVGYERSEDHEKWSGVQVLGSRVALYGEEGLELVRFTSEGPVAEASWTRGRIGRVLSIAPLGEALIVSGAGGLQRLDPATGSLRRIMRRVVLSVAAAADEVLVFADGESVYVSDLELLGQNRVIAQMKLGKTFGPDHVRVLDDTAIVTGPGGVLVIDLADPRSPQALAKLSTREVGEISDATRVRGRIFLVGQRGLQLLDRSLRRVEETIDVGERRRVAVMGRHLVTADPAGLQVVDATPWAEAGSVSRMDEPLPASAEASRERSSLDGSDR